MRFAAVILVGTLGICDSVSQQTATFRSSIDVVSVPVSVTEKNRPVANLTAADFELWDNGVRQDVTLTTIEEMPTDVTLLVDTSGSISGKALERIKVDIQEMSALLQPNDRLRVVSFARDATDVFGLMSGGATLELDRMRSGGVTSLYDALVTVLAAQPMSDRPQMVFVVTDGRDNSSFVTALHVVDVARSSSAVLFLVLVRSSNPLVREGGAVDAVDPMATEQSVVNVAGSSSPLIPGVNLPLRNSGIATMSISRSAGAYKGGPNTSVLKEAAAVTGGLLYSDSSRAPVPELFRRVLDDFRASYVLTYTPTGVDRIGTHTLDVRSRNSRYIVRARKSYEQR